MKRENLYKSYIILFIEMDETLLLTSKYEANIRFSSAIARYLTGNSFFRASNGLTIEATSTDRPFYEFPLMKVNSQQFSGRIEFGGCSIDNIKKDEKIIVAALGELKLAATYNLKSGTRAVVI